MHFNRDVYPIKSIPLNLDWISPFSFSFFLNAVYTMYQQYFRKLFFSVNPANWRNILPGVQYVNAKPSYLNWAGIFLHYSSNLIIA